MPASASGQPAVRRCGPNPSVRGRVSAGGNGMRNPQTIRGHHGHYRIGGSSMGARKVVVDGLGKLPAFCHAVVAGDFIYVSGTLGTKAGSFELVEGGTGPETTQTMRNIETILAGCDATLADLVKVNVFLSDMETFSDMNAAYMAVIGDEPPARITVGRAALALGAAVEIDAIAYKERDSA
jgi:2-iminobutanoate/2-iminopropanoate deaminase